jgi:hypothetical protein
MIHQKLLIDGNHFKLILILLTMVIIAGCREREMTSSEYIKWITEIEIPEDSEFLGAEIENEIVDAPAFYKVKFTESGLEEFLKIVRRYPIALTTGIGFNVNGRAPRWWRHNVVTESYEMEHTDTPNFYMRVDVERVESGAMVYLAIFPF